MKRRQSWLDSLRYHLEDDWDMKRGALGNYLIVFTLLGTASSFAQMSPKEAYAAQQDANVAFQCAAWANVDDGRSIEKSEVERLAAYGYDLALKAFTDQIENPNDNYSAMFKRAPADFWVGSLWTQANFAVNRGLEFNVPVADHPFAELQVLRAANASANFAQQGCASFGKP
jgi:hypothetical protein